MSESKNDNQEPELTCSEKFSNCMADTSHMMYHKDAKTGENLYCWNTSNNWSKILACIFGLWIGVGLYTWFNIEAILKYGQTVLWVYLIIALCFVCVVGGMIAVGHVDYRAATLVQELERMKRAKDEATDNDFADPVAAGDSGCIIN